MDVTIVGTGYVGLVTGACLAEAGARVVCVDVDAARVDSLDAGIVPIHEPGLDAIVARTTRAGRLRFSTDLAASIGRAEVVILAVGTPEGDGGQTDLRAIDEVLGQMVLHARRELVVVLKSTVPVGTHARAREALSGSRWPIHVVSNPEFLKEGDAVSDFLHPERIVGGCEPGDDHARPPVPSDAAPR